MYITLLETDEAIKNSSIVERTAIYLLNNVFGRKIYKSLINTEGTSTRNIAL